MALDFHIARSEDEAAYQRPDYSFQEQMHTQLFHRTTDLKPYPLIGRMNCYFSNVSYSVNELEALITELDSAIPRFVNRPQMRRALEEFRAMCQRASETELMIFGFCD